MPKLNEAYRQIEELKAQHNWLKHSLDKCIKTLETERRLEPIPRKHHLPLIGDPNLVDEYSHLSEPWFFPYEEPNLPSMLEEPDDSVKCLVGMMGIRIASDRLYLDSSTSYIDNFEERLKRLEDHLEE
jgi:hypothetical protein